MRRDAGSKRREPLSASDVFRTTTEHNHADAVLAADDHLERNAGEFSRFASPIFRINKRSK
jgi:hypothetical protein